MYPVIVNANEDVGSKHIRCYCNLPQCITTSYMCKSPSGGCFSHLLPDLMRHSHGCIESLEDRNHKATCMNSPSASPVVSIPGSRSAGQASVAAGGSIVLCCFKDLCNHVDTPQLHHRLNDTLMANWNGAHNTAGSHLAAGAGAADTTNYADVWFKAATIAVPICGAIILFLLIAVAVKLLRADALDISNKLSASYNPQNSGHCHSETPLMKKIPPTVVGRPYDPSDPTATAAGAPILMMHVCETTPPLKEGNLVATQQHTSLLMLQKPNNNAAAPSSVHVKDVNLNLSNCLRDEAPPNCGKLYDKETILFWGRSGAAAVTCPR